MLRRLCFGTFKAKLFIEGALLKIRIPERIERIGIDSKSAKTDDAYLTQAHKLGPDGLPFFGPFSGIGSKHASAREGGPIFILDPAF